MMTILQVDDTRRTQVFGEVVGGEDPRMQKIDHRNGVDPSVINGTPRRYNKTGGVHLD